MALIKCSECGADISEKASACPKCGCPLDITKQVMSDAKKKKNKKVIIFFIVVLAFIMILSMGIFFVKRNNDPGNIAIRLIKKILEIISVLIVFIIIPKSMVALLNSQQMVRIILLLFIWMIKQQVIKV